MVEPERGREKEAESQTGTGPAAQPNQVPDMQKAVPNDGIQRGADEHLGATSGKSAVRAARQKSVDDAALTPTEQVLITEYLWKWVSRACVVLIIVGGALGWLGSTYLAMQADVVKAKARSIQGILDKVDEASKPMLERVQEAVDDSEKAIEEITAKTATAEKELEEVKRVSADAIAQAQKAREAAGAAEKEVGRAREKVKELDLGAEEVAGLKEAMKDMDTLAGKAAQQLEGRLGRELLPRSVFDAKVKELEARIETAEARRRKTLSRLSEALHKLSVAMPATPRYITGSFPDIRQAQTALRGEREAYDEAMRALRGVLTDVEDEKNK